MLNNCQFAVSTSGHCFFCLKQAGNEQNEGGAVPGKVFPLRNMFQYLKMSFKEVFSGSVLLPMSPDLPQFAESDLGGTLCPECVQYFTLFSKYCLELEVIQMKLKSCLKSLYDRMLEVEGNYVGRLEEFNKKMWSQRETILQHGIVNRLRKETMERCSKMVETFGPRVCLKRVPKPIPRPVNNSKVPTPEENFQSSFPEGSVTNRDPTNNYLFNSSQQFVSVPEVDAVYKMDKDSIRMNANANELPGGENITNCLRSSPEESEGTMDQDESNLVVALLKCDICHLEVCDLSSHLYSAHHDEYVQSYNMNGAISSSSSMEPGQGQSLPPVATFSRPIQVQVTEVRQRSSLPAGPVSTSPYHKCQLCSDQFLTRIEMISHTNKAHFPNRVSNRAPKQKRSFDCEDCGKRFNLRGGLQRHRNQIHLQIRFPCNLCSYVFATSVSLERHRRNFRHENEEQYKCDDCPQRFSTPYARASHVLKNECQRRTT